MATPLRLTENRFYFRSPQETGAGSGLEVEGSKRPKEKKGLFRPSWREHHSHTECESSVEPGVLLLSLPPLGGAASLVCPQEARE